MNSHLPSHSGGGGGGGSGGAHYAGGGGGPSNNAVLPSPPSLDLAAKQSAIETFARRGLNLPAYISSSIALRERSLILRPAIGPSAAGGSAPGNHGSGSAGGGGGGGGGNGGGAPLSGAANATTPSLNVLSLAWSPDGRKLASCGSRSVSPHGPTPSPTAALSASAVNANAAAAAERMLIRIWTPEYSTDPRSTIELRGHTDHIEQVAFSPVSVDLLASTGYDRTVKVWDTRTTGNSGSTNASAGTDGKGGSRPASKHVLSIPTSNRNLNMKYHPSGNYIAVGDRMDDVTLFDIRTGKELGYISKDAPFQINRFTWSASGDLFFLTCGTGEIRILDSRSLNTLNASDKTELPRKREGGDVLDWPLLHTIAAHHSIAHNVQVDPLGRAILSSGQDACVNLFTTASPYSATAFASMRTDDDSDDDHHYPGMDDPDQHTTNGHTSFSSSSLRQRAFLPPDYTLMHSFTEFETPAHAVGFSADGEMWAAGGDQGWVEVASTAAPHASLIRLPYPLGSIKSIAFNPAGSHPGRAHVLAYAGEENTDAVRSFAAGGGDGSGSGGAGSGAAGPTMSALGTARGIGAGGTIRIVGLKGQS
ncbi:hypothetical protein CF326_g5247 [Tilletia indica]|nr:hypothetical protein CF326_g5247 [Tilletia indica]